MKKGALSIETIIVMIIAISVLVLILMFISGKWVSLTSSFNEIEQPVSNLINDSLLWLGEASLQVQL